MTNSPWQIHDKTAADQLGLTEDYKIIMMSVEVDYFDEDAFLDEFENSLSLFTDEVKEEIQHHLHHIKLPVNHVLVAMQSEKDIIYGIVNINP